jgi:hypothetical protein
MIPLSTRLFSHWSLPLNRKKWQTKLSHAPPPPSLSGGRETFPRRLPLDDSGGSDTPRRRGDGKVSEKLTSALVTSLSLSSEPESWSSLSRVGKNPCFFFFLNLAQWVFLFFFGFFGFFGFFWVFWFFFIYLLRRESFRVFSV